MPETAVRSLEQFLTDYSKSHRNPTNRLIHYICVPVIFFATLGLFWLVPIGRWLDLDGVAADSVNLATLAAVLALVFYARLSAASLVSMLAWSAVSFALILAIESTGGSVLVICASLWVAAWALQFYGHKVEGAKPSFADDLVFLLIGPLFVQHELIGSPGKGKSHA